MQLHTAYDFPYELVTGYNHKLTQAELEILAVASLCTNIVVEDGKILGVFGSVPFGFLSTDALVWATLPKDLQLSRGTIRRARKLFSDWAVNSPWTLYAEVWQDHHEGHSLARFIGFTPVEETETLIRYKYKGPK